MSLNLIHSYILNYFHHFQPFLYYKKCARLKEVIRPNFDQCGQYGSIEILTSGIRNCTNKYINLLDISQIRKCKKRIQEHYKYITFGELIIIYLTLVYRRYEKYWGPFIYLASTNVFQKMVSMWICYESKLKCEIAAFKIISANLQAQWKYLPIMIELSR